MAAGFIPVSVAQFLNPSIRDKNRGSDNLNGFPNSEGVTDSREIAANIVWEHVYFSL